MKIRVQNIKQPLSEGDEQIARLICEQVNVDPKQILGAKVVRRSLDARKKQEIHFLINAVVEVDETAGRKLISRGDARFELYREAPAEPIPQGSLPLRGRVVVAGLGPSGCLRRCFWRSVAYAPLVLERGSRWSAAL